jgi:hypothetical protein
MNPMNAEIRPLLDMTDEDLIASLGLAADKHPNVAAVHRILEFRRAKDQSAAAKGLLEATERQATAGDALVKATGDLVSATGRLARATWTLGVMTGLLVLVAAFQGYVMFRWHP